MQKTNRRQFLVQGISGVMAAGALALMQTACARSENASGEQTNPQRAGVKPEECNGTFQTTYSNPGHAHSTLSLSLQEVQAAQPGTYVLLDGSHSHSFSMEQTDFVDLINGKDVQKVDLEGHGHIVVLSCGR